MLPVNEEVYPDTLDQFIEKEGLSLQFEDIKIGEEIARGGYGVVYGGTLTSTGRPVALKFFGYTRNPPHLKWIEKEIRLMTKVKNCPNAVQILGVFTDHRMGSLPRKLHLRVFPVIVMEKLNGEDLFYRIIQAGRFSERDASKIFASFIRSVHYSHTKARVINCDLKAENVVFQSREVDDFSIKIIDFGTALNLPVDGSDFVFDNVKRGTEALIAPETSNCYNKFRAFVYSKQTDIWQAGCFLFIILFAALPFGEGQEAEQRILDSIVTECHLPYYFHGGVSTEAKDLILRMLDKNPATRISTADILKHPWVRYTEQVSDEDLGTEYRTRVKSWAYCKQLKRVLADKITAGFERKILLENVLIAANNANNGTEMDEGNDEQEQQSSIVLTPEDFRYLQLQFVECCRQMDSREVTFEAFTQIVTNANMAYFARPDIFEVFDQDGSKTVDYFEFLLTLIPFRADANVENIARLYFEVFDVDGNHTISQEELQWILSKLLSEAEGGALMHPAAMIYQESLLGTVLEAHNFDDIFKCIDTNGDGVISFEEFDMFFKVINSRSTYHQSIMAVATTHMETAHLS
mmetsp:Transcript_6951/g.10312  ORF Transcript_6951/g.10312 Transcript_6951/m.10312 type:complete len:578 (-) Transcript_6951:377-2110(-)